MTYNCVRYNIGALLNILVSRMWMLLDGMLFHLLANFTTYDAQWGFGGFHVKCFQETSQSLLRDCI